MKIAEFQGLQVAAQVPALGHNLRPQLVTVPAATQQATVPGGDEHGSHTTGN